MPDSSPVVRRCPLCRVDVSVPGDFVDPRCPSCDAPLVASLATPDESSETLLEVRKDSALDLRGARDSRSARAEDATLRDIPLEPPSGGSTQRRATAAEGTRRLPDEDSLLDTATFPGQMEPGEERVVGNYRLVRILGKGGMGIVYEAVHRELARSVALKVMSIRDAGVEELERFKREARAAAKLRHPNIVPILDVGEHEGQHFFTMDLVRGQTLTALARSHQLTPERSAEILAKVSRAIHHAHEAGVIHRDLKPSNILVDEQGEPHVMDFGLAKDLSDVSGLTLTGVAMGSPPYMPPEQARGEFRQVDAVSDVYGLGASLYECLAGRAPFTGKSLYDIIAKVLVEDPTPPSQVKAEVPYDLETICLKALEKEKWRRYPSALDLALDLDRFSQGASIRARRQGLTTKIGRYLVRNRSVIVAVLLPLALAAALGTFAFGRNTPPREERKSPASEPALLGPVAKSAKLAGTLQLEQALRELCRALPERPRADAAVAGVSAMSSASLPVGVQRVLLGLETVGSASLSAEQLAELLEALGRAPPQDLSRAQLVAGCQSLLDPDDPWGPWLTKLTLALRARETRSTDDWKAVFEGALTPHDLPLLQALSARRTEPTDQRLGAAIEELTPAESPQRALPSAPHTLVRAPSGRLIVAAPAGGARWSFPEFALPGEAGRQPLRGRFGQLGAPSPPLRSLDGRSLYLVWQRFAFKLRARDGAVLARRRLPGLALGCDYHPAGGIVVTAKVGDDEQARVSLDAELRGEFSGPVDPWAWRDQLWREACALVPEFERLIALERPRPDDPDAPAELAWIELQLGPGEVLDVGFSQGRPPGAPVRLARTPADPGEECRIQATQRLPKSYRGRPVVALRRVDRSGGKRYAGIMGLSLFVADEEGFIDRRGYTYDATRSLESAEWLALAARVAGLLEPQSQAPNPWLQAFRAAALAQGEQPDPALAQEAASGPGLDPRARVELACLLDAHGYEAAADQALSRALLERSREGPVLPDWAGWGELDPGRRLADWVDRCRFQFKRWKRGDELAQWRDAFAPNLRSGRWTRAALRHARVDATRPPTGAPPLPRALWSQRPTRGLAGLDAAGLARVDHAIRLASYFVGSLFGVLLLFLLRSSRYARRDLARLGFNTRWSRFRLWWTRPVTRLNYSAPTYLSHQDKLALILVFLVMIWLFALQEASLQVLIRTSGPAAQELVSGAPRSPQTERLLTSVSERPQAIYTLAWLRRARGDDLDEIEHHLLKLGVTSSRHYLLWAESQQGDRRERALARAEVPAEHEPYLELARARARGDAAGVDAAERALAELDPAWATYVWARRQAAEQGLSPPRPLPAAPAPSASDRDELLLGGARWSSKLPYLYLLNLLGLYANDAWQGALQRFQFVHNTKFELPRFHNESIWAVPALLLLLIALLFVPCPHRFEPLDHDRSPPPTIRLLRLLYPGAPQLMLGRTVRGILLLFPFMYLVSSVSASLELLPRGEPLIKTFFARSITSVELGHLTGEVASAMPLVRQNHLLELVLLLGLIYALHWLDLAMSQRKSYASEDEDRPAPRREREPEFIIPLDSEAAIASEVPRTSGTAPGPFDATEAGGPPDRRPVRAKAVEGDSDELPILPDLSDSDDGEHFEATATELPILPDLSDSDEGEPPFDRTERDLPAPPVERTELDLRRPRDPSDEGESA